MPSADDILAGLTRAANDGLAVAAAWHVVLALAIFALGAKIRRPTARSAAIATAAPLVSVSVLAWHVHNPFNAVVFAGATFALVALGLRVPTRPPSFGPGWAVALGTVLLVLGWTYPHFLPSRPAWLYAVAAPLGVVPCATLCVVLGVALCMGAFGSRAWGLTAAGVGLVYGLFGALYLGVWLDLALAGAAVALIVLEARRHPRRHRAHPSHLVEVTSK